MKYYFALYKPGLFSYCSLVLIWLICICAYIFVLYSIHANLDKQTKPQHFVTFQF